MYASTLPRVLVSNSRRCLRLLLSVVLAIPLIVVGPATAGSAPATDASLEAYTEVPIAGADRFGTAVAASQAAFASGAACVVIATGRNWPDALGGAALAGVKEGPILLSDTNDVPDGTMTEIIRLGAAEAIILGGTGAVGPAAEAELKTRLGTDKVTRIGGANRYQTAQMVAQATVDANSEWDGTAFCATGANFPDALAAAPIAAAMGWPIYLSETDHLGATKGAMQAAGVQIAMILGGTGAISSAVESDLGATFGGVERLAGDNRYETAVEVATFGVLDCGLVWDSLAIATGQDFPDALTGGVLQGRDNSVMLLTPSNTLADATYDALEMNQEEITEVKFLGGLGAVTQYVRDWVKVALGEAEPPEEPEPPGPPTTGEGNWIGTNVSMHVQDGMLTTTGSSLEEGAALIVTLPYGGVTITNFYYDDIPVTNNAFSFEIGTVSAPGGRVTVTGTFSGNTCTGHVTHNENSFQFSGSMEYDYTSTLQ